VHSINVHREEIGGCYEVTLDGQFVVATPSKQLAGDAVLEQIRRAGEVVLIGFTDDGPARRDMRNRSLTQQTGREAAARIRAARGEQESWRP
jgi:hypothetical protein